MAATTVQCGTVQKLFPCCSPDLRRSLFSFPRKGGHHLPRLPEARSESKPRSIHGLRRMEPVLKAPFAFSFGAPPRAPWKRHTVQPLMRECQKQVPLRVGREIEGLGKMIE